LSKLPKKKKKKKKQKKKKKKKKKKKEKRKRLRGHCEAKKLRRRKGAHIPERFPAAGVIKFSGGQSRTAQRR